ncbi:hypothetical protein IscW_ISCW000576 [Ixodes scapularis]|uniref:Uncharacterized protein n=1 Tax=Ixodes scapularis TaxID=6945 RepID=B7P721_IXOSC|nr:hypothetical protein IscW_ISCW000576 [Ixodes scapularis]|eukprot:XP_002409476.1 hypothetical protein IscW_ISCW000576 [Ixodes scapularis]
MYQQPAMRHVELASSVCVAKCPARSTGWGKRRSQKRQKYFAAGWILSLWVRAAKRVQKTCRQQVSGESRRTCMAECRMKLFLQSVA